MTSLGLALASVKEKPLRSGLMVLSVSVTIGVLVAMCAMVKYIAAIESTWSGENDFVSVRASVQGRLPIAYVNQIGRVPGAQPVVWTTSSVRPVTTDGYVYSIHASSQGLPDHVPKRWFDIPSDVATRWKSDKRGMVAKRDVAAHYGWTVGQLVNVETSIGPIDLVVDGIVDGLCEPRILIHFEYMDDFRKRVSPKDEGMLGAVWVKADPSRVSEVSDAIDAAFANSAMPVVAGLSSESARSAYKSQFNVADLVTLVALVATLVTMLVTTNTFFINMRERRVEIGSLRAIGYRRSRVMAMIGLESLVIWWVGGSIGVLLTWAMFAFNRVSIASAGLDIAFHIDPASAAIGLGATTVLALFTAALPGWSATRLDVIEALASR